MVFNLPSIFWITILLEYTQVSAFERLLSQEKGPRIATVLHGDE
jgi:hypothetical protein